MPKAVPLSLALLLAAGCVGRSDVAQNDQKANKLPAQPHATPQLHPGAPLPSSTRPATRAANVSERQRNTPEARPSPTSTRPTSNDHH